MNHLDVRLIGVFGTDNKPIEGFTYTVDAPVNLWVGACCADGSRMGHRFMAFILNELIDNDQFAEGDWVEVVNQDGVVLTATIGREVPAEEVEAFWAETPTVRIVEVDVNAHRR